jgi:HD superfamily phosphodiesterase
MESNVNDTAQNQSIPVPNSLVEFVKVAYARHDLAHDIKHVYRVWEYAKQIITREPTLRQDMTDTEFKEFPYAILLHDARDHKLVNRGICLPAETIAQFLILDLSEASAQKILLMHERCSWSNRTISEPLPTGDWMRRVLQDADWLDALGEIGITRSEDYARLNGADANEVIAHTKRHIVDKLLLVPAAFTYEISRQIARENDLIRPLEQYLRG